MFYFHFLVNLKSMFKFYYNAKQSDIKGFTGNNKEVIEI